MLKDNSFSCFVVGEVRGKGGTYYNFVADTIRAFNNAGLLFYNDIVMLTAIGTLPIRAGRAFNSGRKVGKAHQNVLVFVKGDWKIAAEKCPELDLYICDDDL